MEWVLGLVVGLLVGAVGIGGVLIVPILSLLLGREIEIAIASASTSFLFSSSVACLTYHLRGAIAWRAALPLCIGIVPGVLLGVVLGTLLPTQVLGAITGGLLLASGANQLLGATKVRESGGTAPMGFAGAVLGVGVGATSSLTGTGGPVLMTPILLWRRVPVRAVVGISQAISLPVAVMASIGYGVAGRVDFALAAALGVSMALGVPVGAAIAARVPIRTLQRIVSLAVLVSGALLLARSV